MTGIVEAIKTRAARVSKYTGEEGPDVAAATEDDVDPKTEFVQRGSARMSGLMPGRWSLSARKVGPTGGGDPITLEVLVRPGQSAPATLRFD